MPLPLALPSSSFLNDRFTAGRSWFSSSDNLHDDDESSLFIADLLRTNGSSFARSSHKSGLFQFHDAHPAKHLPNLDVIKGYQKLLATEIPYIFSHNTSRRSFVSDSGFSWAAMKLLRPIKLNRSVNLLPITILDAPGLLDDFYLNLLDWSCRNILAVALLRQVYLWKGSDKSVSLLVSLTEGSNECWTTLSWMEDGIHLALGTSSGKLQIWDTEKIRRVVEVENPNRSRVTCSNWNGRLLSIGGRDQEIRHLDIRLPCDVYKRQSSAVGLFSFHTHEVCGLKWDSSGRFLASGGNDNILCIWDIRKSSSTTRKPDSSICQAPQFLRKNSIQDAVGETTRPLYIFRDHAAAVKAIDWCPHKSHFLASGGGTLDKKLMLWDISVGKCLATVDTGSQICNMKWSPYSGTGVQLAEMEILTTHGFTQNQLILWKVSPLSGTFSVPQQQAPPYSSSSSSNIAGRHLFKDDVSADNTKRFVPLVNIKGHTQRVVHMSVNPRTALVTTGSGDETLRFWNIFGARNEVFDH